MIMKRLEGRNQETILENLPSHAGPAVATSKHPVCWICWKGRLLGLTPGPGYQPLNARGANTLSAGM